MSIYNDITRIESAALKGELYKKGYTLSSASRRLGFCDSWFSYALRKGSIRSIYFDEIEKKLGIKADKYVKHIIKPIQISREDTETNQVIDRNMVRNVDVEFIRFRAHELGLPLKSFCDVMGKKDNYLSNLRVNGAKEADLKRIAMILRIEPDDERLFLKPQTVEEAPQETVDNLQTRLHKQEAKVADLYAKVKELTEQNEELTKRLEGAARLNSSIVGTLASKGIYVGKEKGNGNGQTTVEHIYGQHGQVPGHRA